MADLIYHPSDDPAAAAAAGARGLTTVGGLGMLVHQAAAAFTLWTGAEAPLAAMAAAATAGARAQPVAWPGGGARRCRRRAA